MEFLREFVSEVRTDSELATRFRPYDVKLTVLIAELREMEFDRTPVTNQLSSLGRVQKSLNNELVTKVADCLLRGAHDLVLRGELYPGPNAIAGNLVTPEDYGIAFSSTKS